MNHTSKNILATRMNGGNRTGRFDSVAWLHRKKQKHLKLLRQMGIMYSRYYRCSTKA